MYWLYRACAGVILLSKDVSCWRENPVTLSATELFIHWFRPNFSDLVYNGHQGPDTFTPDRNLQLLWFQVVIHPLNIPENGEKGDVESLKKFLFSDIRVVAVAVRGRVSTTIFFFLDHEDLKDFILFGFVSQLDQNFPPRLGFEGSE